MTGTAETHAATPPATPERRAIGAARSPFPGVRYLAPALYLGVSLVFFGRHALAHLGSVAVASNDIDSSQYQWFMAWWPHAILHGLNPFITHVAFVPDGYNLTWTTSQAGPALVLAPITELFGATVSFNVFSLLAPALSGWAAFALCRRLTGAVWPAVFGGLAFELSGYMLTATQADPWLALVALLPLAVLLVLRLLEGSLGPRRFVILLGAALAFQFVTSAEILATGTLFGAVVLLGAYVLFAERRSELRRAVGLIAAAFALAGVVLSPFLIAMIGPHPVPDQAITFSRIPVDPSSFWVPTSVQARGTWQANHWHSLGVGNDQNGFAYLGFPLALIVLAFLVRTWRERATRLMALAFLVTVISVLGVRLVLGGDSTGLPLPWALLHHVPLLRYALPVRAAVYPALIASVILALWLVRARSAWPWLGGAVAIAAMVPNLSSPVWHSSAVDPSFFSSGEYRSYLRPTDNVVTYPGIGPNLRWQAHTGFAFRLVGGYLGAFPHSYTRFAAWSTILSGRPASGWPQELRSYLDAKGATVAVVEKGYGPDWRHLFDPLHIRPIDTGGVLFYRLRPPAR